jgi:threonine dehydratase
LITLPAGSRIEATRCGSLVDCLARLKLVTEPSGASALAALMTGKADGRDKRLGVTISGGNIGLDGFCQIINQRDR